MYTRIELNGLAYNIPADKLKSFIETEGKIIQLPAEIAPSLAPATEDELRPYFSGAFASVIPMLLEPINKILEQRRAKAMASWSAR